MLLCPNEDCGYRRSGEKRLSNRRCPQCHKKMELKEGKAGMYVQCISCGITEVLEKDKDKHMNKREQQRLVKQYSQPQESGGVNLGELLKAALEKKGDD